MIALALLLASADPANAVVVAKPKLLVLDFQDQGVGENAAKIVHDTLASRLSKDARLDVISTEDVRRVVDVEAEKRATLGTCNDEACLAEIAGALGAQLMMYGTIGKLGDLVVVNISVFDAKSGKSVGRETVQAKSLEDLPDRVSAAGDRLVAEIPGLGPASSPGLGVLGYTGAGAALVGAGFAITGGIVALLNNPHPGDGLSFEQKEAELLVRDLWAGIGALGLGLGVAGAGVAAIDLTVVE
jgi:TolB-like protein